LRFISGASSPSAAECRFDGAGPSFPLGGPLGNGGWNAGVTKSAKGEVGIGAEKLVTKCNSCQLRPFSHFREAQFHLWTEVVEFSLSSKVLLLIAGAIGKSALDVLVDRVTKWLEETRSGDGELNIFGPDNKVVLMIKRAKRHESRARRILSSQDTDFCGVVEENNKLPRQPFFLGSQHI
jgi:hypothetical protein